MKGLEIARVSPDEWQILRELRLHAVKEEHRAFGKSYEEELQESEEEWRQKLATSVYVIAKEMGKPVGMLCGVQQKGNRLQHVANIYGVYVVPEARGKQIATLLMEALMNELRARGVKKVCLYVTKPQKAAIALYTKLGFKQVGLHEKEMFVDGKYLDSIAMEKFI